MRQLAAVGPPETAAACPANPEAPYAGAQPAGGASVGSAVLLLGCLAGPHGRAAGVARGRRAHTPRLPSSVTSNNRSGSSLSESPVAYRQTLSLSFSLSSVAQLRKTLPRILLRSWTCHGRHVNVMSFMHDGSDHKNILDLFGSQIQGDLIGAVQWRIYQGAAKEFGSATSGSSP